MMIGRERAKATRSAILAAAEEAIYRHGYRGAGVAAIVRKAKVTKGAFYHHFDGKGALGAALIDDVIADRLTSQWLDPLEDQDDPLTALLRTIEARVEDGGADLLRHGSPLGNLAQELSAVDDGLRVRLEAVYRGWRKGLGRHLRRGQQKGTVRSDVDTDRAAAFIVAGIEGSLLLGKTFQSLDDLGEALLGLAAYVEGLRP